MPISADITGPSEVKFVQDYLRPISEATINFRNDYLLPLVRIWSSYAAVTGGGGYSLLSDSFTGGFSQGIVYDGFSADHFNKLNGEMVNTISKALIAINTEITVAETDLIRAAARSSFSTETIDLRQSTQGTGGWVAE